VGDDFVIGYAKRVIDPDAVVFGAFMHGVLCAIGELRGLQQSGAREAEVAVSVETDWQGRGIGGDLFARLVNASQNRGVRALNVLYMSGNSRMKSIAGKHSPELFTDSGQIEARFSLPWATPLSIAREMIGDVCAAARCSVTELVFGRHRLTA
jgi:GNAT superfamily N-acetyltransferase